LHVQLDTSAGPIEIRLDTDHAPVAALALLSQVRAGALDASAPEPGVAGLLVHLGLPAAQLGRHEDSSAAVEPGAVLIEDLGRDALTGRLAIVLSREPAFDGRFTVVGHVTRGLDVAASLHELDRIEDAHVAIAGPETHP
jgi:cyclophilin family peptidyl-prolyl cis-trans isomerase